MPAPGKKRLAAIVCAFLPLADVPSWAATARVLSVEPASRSLPAALELAAPAETAALPEISSLEIPTEFPAAPKIPFVEASVAAIPERAADIARSGEPEKAAPAVLQSLEGLEQASSPANSGAPVSGLAPGRFWDGARTMPEPVVGAPGAGVPDDPSAGTGSGLSRDGSRTLPPETAVSQAPLPGEIRLAVLSGAWSFLTIASIYVIMPVRSALLVSRFGTEILPWVYMASALATGAAVWAYQKFAYLPRAKLLGGGIAALSASLAAWWAVTGIASKAAWMSFSFYIWADVFAIMCVTLFWTFANDVFSREGAKRQFGRINAAGTVGGIAGAWLVDAWVKSLGIGAMLGIGWALFTATLGVLWLAERSAGASREQAPSPGRKKTLGETWRMIRGSRYLLLLAALVAFERLVPDFSNYLYTAVVHEAYPDKEGFAAIAARFEFWENIVGLGLGFFFTHWVLKRLGTGAAALSAPLANLLGFLLYLVWPTLGVVVAYNGLDGLFRHTLFKSGKEASYTVAGKEAIYQVKPVIEMFLYRLSRGVAGFLLLFLTGKFFFGLGLPGVAVAAVPLGVLWVWIAWSFGRQVRDMETSQKL